MHIQEYIGNGAVLQRLQYQMTDNDLAEFNTLADLYPELQQELVYAYNLLTEISASCPPDQVSVKFTEAYNGYLQKYRDTHGLVEAAEVEAEDLSHQYASYARIYKAVFIFYLIFLATAIALTIYFYSQIADV